MTIKKCKHCNKKLLDHKSGLIPFCPVGKKDRGIHFNFSTYMYYEEDTKNKEI